MNKGMMILVAAFALQSMSAMAVHRPGWERPIARAQMTEIDETGHEVGVGLEKVLTMHRQDGAPKPTMLSLVEEKKVFCVRAPCPPIKETVEYVVLRKENAGCGSVKYIGMDKQALLFARNAGLDPRLMPHAARSIELVDHRTRLCDDYKKYMWEAKVSAAGRGGMRIRNLYGNPESVASIQ